ncbi:MAG TPA: hypothetical protein DEQ17_02965 [Prevotella sp.]|nr:hypothetical protein [Prevotella sp.]
MLSYLNAYYNACFKVSAKLVICREQECVMDKKFDSQFLVMFRINLGINRKIGKPWPREVMLADFCLLFRLAYIR